MTKKQKKLLKELEDTLKEIKKNYGNKAFREGFHYPDKRDEFKNMVLKTRTK